MKNTKLLVSLPNDLNKRFKAMVPARQRSHVIHRLLEDEIKRREEQLYACAAAVEADQHLTDDMSDWDITLNDGSNNETW